MKRQKHLTVEEVHEPIFNRVMEEKSTDEEDSGSEEEETHEEVIDVSYRPNSSSEEAPTSPASEMEENEYEEVESEMEEVSEVEDRTYFEEVEESTDEEESEEEDPAEMEEYFQSKNEKMIWSSIPPCDGRRMVTAEKAERETSRQGPTLYARSRIEDIKSAFYLFLPKAIEDSCRKWPSKTKLNPRLLVSLELPEASLSAFCFLLLFTTIKQ
ncbi:hypothetical protein JOQ06_009152, partial [Pogonophryne albipinna]